MAGKTLFARRERAYSAYLKSMDLTRYDVQLYRDREATQPFLRYPWFMAKPHGATGSVRIEKCVWRVVWLPTKEV